MKSAKTLKKASVSKKSNNKKISAKNSPSQTQKQLTKSRKVTFRLPKEAAPDAAVVTIVGDFNNWNETETVMKKLKSGDFKATLELSSEKEYRYRYLIDSSRWENDWQADEYVPNPFGCDDSLIKV